MYLCISQALWSQEVWTAVVLRNFWRVTSNTALVPPSSPEVCGIAEALLEGCIPAVRAPHYYPCFSAIELSITQLPAMVPITGAGWSTAQDLERQVLHLEQDVLLKLTSRRLWDQATIPVTAETAAWVFITGYKPPTTATKQMQESKSENDPSTEKQITALLHFLITFSFW